MVGWRELLPRQKLRQGDIEACSGPVFWRRTLNSSCCQHLARRGVSSSKQGFWAWSIGLRHLLKASQPCVHTAEPPRKQDQVHGLYVGMTSCSIAGHALRIAPMEDAHCLQRPSCADHPWATTQACDRWAASTPRTATFCCLRREGGGQRRAACWGRGQHLHRRRRQAISLLMQPRTAPHSFHLGNLSLCPRGPRASHLGASRPDAFMIVARTRRSGRWRL